jgi:hypothetical protein
MSTALGSLFKSLIFDVVDRPIAIQTSTLFSTFFYTLMIVQFFNIFYCDIFMFSTEVC